MQASAMKTRFQIAGRSLSFAKIMQASAMKTRFQIAERSLSSAKLGKRFDIGKPGVWPLAGKCVNL